MRSHSEAVGHGRDCHLLGPHTVFIDGHPILATASSAGHIALWDLNSGGRLLHLVRGAHDGAVTALEWVPGQPVLISSGEDNSVKVGVITYMRTCIFTEYGLH